MAERQYSSTSQPMTLSAAVNSANLSIAVNSVGGLPPGTPFTLVLDRGLATEEIVTVTAVSGTTLTVERGQDGTAAQAHGMGAEVRHMMTARDLREPQQHISSSAGVHGLGAGVGVVGTSTTQTLTNKTISGTTNTLLDISQDSITGLGDTHDDLVVAAAPPGAISAFAGAGAPTGWLVCDGSAVLRDTYAALYAAIGDTFGAGNGATTFNLPNLKGRVIVGVDAAQTEFDTRGETGGAKTHTLTVDEMPSHTHVQNPHTHTQNPHTHLFDTNVSTGQFTQSGGTGMDGKGDENDFTSSSTPTINAATAVNQNTGGGAAHNNLQPYIALAYIIKT